MGSLLVSFFQNITSLLAEAGTYLQIGFGVPATKTNILTIVCLSGYRYNYRLRFFQAKKVYHPTYPGILLDNPLIPQEWLLLEFASSASTVSTAQLRGWV